MRLQVAQVPVADPYQVIADGTRRHKGITRHDGNRIANITIAIVDVRRAIRISTIDDHVVYDHRVCVIHIVNMVATEVISRYVNFARCQWKPTNVAAE